MADCRECRSCVDQRCGGELFKFAAEPGQEPVRLITGQSIPTERFCLADGKDKAFLLGSIAIGSDGKNTTWPCRFGS